MKFGENSFLALQFKESYRREQQRGDREGDGVRKRRALPASSEQFSIRFRTRNDGLLLFATDSVVTSVSGYTVVEVSLKLFFFFRHQFAPFQMRRKLSRVNFHKTSWTVTKDGEIIGQYS